MSCVLVVYTLLCHISAQLDRASSAYQKGMHRRASRACGAKAHDHLGAIVDDLQMDPNLPLWDAIIHEHVS